ncbi:hypothetical protein BC939DRAFT_505411 [Gamsiella multidivaricata]|uniref:uncharacterized protein n=1 Tax=Gamsiella multidivaricata TaxID=101098 RepID=UPI00221FD52B|nr:uncharacterized protein BC939DRAFT_505411 [Gamsiella multidivaricata]KAI7819964.1 hypothetical protein BC939DRAFT_505411 [Gamsiella multidivaricata]
MNRIRLKLIAILQEASPPGIMGIDAILKAQEEARLAEELERQKKESRRLEEDDDSDTRSSSDSGDDEKDGATDGSMGSTVTRGYVPSPGLVHHIIPGTQATPMEMSAYLQHVFEQTLDEIALKESILEALETIAVLKDSGADELPPLLDQQLTNMVLLWELEPYLETAPERNQVEESLGVVSWQMENVK